MTIKKHINKNKQCKWLIVYIVNNSHTNGNDWTYKYTINYFPTDITALRIMLNSKNKNSRHEYDIVITNIIRVPC